MAPRRGRTLLLLLLCLLASWDITTRVVEATGSPWLIAAWAVVVLVLLAAWIGGKGWASLMATSEALAVRWKGGAS